MHETYRTTARHLLAAVALAGLVGALAAIPASATAPALTFHLNGIHPADSDLHQGSFTAPLPLCPAGTWQGNGMGSRIFNCADGSGTFTARFNGELEHVAGVSGPWSIYDGTGRFATLRGLGTGTIDSSTGLNASPITFSETWTGVVDFDATSPTARFIPAKVVRPRARTGRWTVRVGFAATDNVGGNPVSFDAIASSGPFFAHRAGTVATGTTVLTFSFRKLPRMRRFDVELRLSDPVGNTSTLKTSIYLR
jgi:hypothetical protein